MLLIPNSFHSYQIAKSSNSNFEAIAINLILGKNKFGIILTYRPPNKYDPLFLTNWISFFNSLNIQYSDYILLGDFNFPDIDWVNNSVAGNAADSDFLNFVIVNGLNQIILEPTRKNNILDLVIESYKGLISNYNLLPPFYNSDHLQIEIALNLSFKSKDFHAKRPNFRKADFLSMKYSIVRYNWHSIFSHCKNVDEMYECFMSIIIIMIINLILLYVPNTSPRKTSKLPKYIINLRHKRLKLHRSFKSNNNAQDKEACKELAKVIKCETKIFFRNQENKILENGTDRAFWGFVKSKMTAHSNIPALVKDDKVIVDNEIKVEIFNKYFCSVYNLDDGNPPPIRREFTHTIFFGRYAF